MTPLHDVRAAEVAALLGRLVELLSESQPHESPPPGSRALPERVLLTVQEAADQLGIGRTLTYKLMRNGELDSVRIGRLRRIPLSAVQKYAHHLSGGRPRGHVA